MAHIDINNYFKNETASTQTPNSNGVGFFSLKNNGDEALVRIMHDDLSSLEAISLHNIQVDGKWRKVNCVRETPYDPIDSCPLCASGNKRTDRLYLHVIEYTKDESGNIVPQAKVFDRPISDANTIRNLINEYGPLSECLFKIKKNVPNTGNPAADRLQTTYSYIFANPSVYSNDVYVKLPNAFDNYTALGRAVMNKTVDEINQFLTTGEFPQKVTTEQPAAVSEHPVQMPTNTVSRFENTPQQATAVERPKRYY